MSVNLSDGVERSEAELIAVESSLGLSLPADYRRFVSQQDGARPDDNIFDVGDDNDCGIDCFIPIAEIGKERTYIEGLSATRLPIAWAEGGNFVCLETAAPGGVYFSDHEEPDVEYRLANSFDEFINKLRPDSPADTDLDPADVKKVWIDPDFLKAVKKR